MADMARRAKPRFPPLAFNPAAATMRPMSPLTACLTRTARFFALVALSLLLLSFVGSAWHVWGEVFYLFGIPIAVLVALGGAIFRLIAGARLPLPNGRPRDRLLALAAAPALLAITLAAAYPLIRAGSYTGDLARLAINRPRFDAIVSRTRASRETSLRKQDAGVTYAIDAGPPVRLAFISPTGAMRAFQGVIVYDPSDQMTLAKGFDRKSNDFIGPDRITMLFMGGIVGCWHLSDHYYVCWFDD